MINLKRMFYRLLLSYLPVFLIFASLIIIATFIVIKEFAQQETKKANEVFSQYVMQIVDNSLGSIEKMIIYEIQGNDKLTAFFEPGHDNLYMTNYTLSKHLREIYETSSLIDSIYLFRVSDSTILTQHFTVHLNEFSDKKYIEGLYADREFPQKWTEAREFNEFSSQDNRRQVVSLIRKVPLLSGTDGFIVINVSTNMLQRLVEEISSKKVSYINLMDSSGKLIISTAAHNKEGDSGKVLSHLVSDYTKWELFSGIDDKYLIDFASVFSYIYLIILLGVLTLGIIWIVFVTRRNYKPLESIILNLDLYFRQKSQLLSRTGSQDGFKFIASAFEKLIEQAQELEQEFEQSLTIKRRLFFRELLEGSRPISDIEWNIEKEKVRLEGQIQQSTVFIFEIDKYHEFTSRYSSSDQYLLRYVLQTNIQERAASSAIHVWAEWLSNQQLGVLYLHSEISGNQVELVNSFCAGIQAWVNANLSYTVTIGIGSEAVQPADITMSYADALEALKYKLTLGHNRIIHYSDVNIPSQDSMLNQLSSITHFTQLFRLGDEKWKDELNNFFGGLEFGSRVYKDTKNLLNYLIFHLQHEINELPEDMQRIWNEIALPNLMGSLDKYDILEDLQSCFVQILTHSADLMQKIRDDRGNSQLIRQIMEYIEEHYTNPDISLNHLGDAFYINPNYLSRLFKEELGQNFVDYLIRVRMEHAMSYLAQTDEQIQQIATMVGYTYCISFIRVFKKTVGMTPGEYRKRFSASQE